MSAKTSGSSTDPSGSTKSRATSDKNSTQGSTGRAFTPEQKTAVIRVRRCSPTAFYDILGLESTRSTCTDTEIKKAYRKLSLLTHPDKNGYDGADEAFKMVSRAFQILSNADKKNMYDKHGIDSDTRSAGAPSASPFSGFAQPRAGGGGNMFEQEISPEEIFRQFFGGGGGMGGPFGSPFGGLFDAGPQFRFNMGGGPGVRVHQFGGDRARRRPHNHTHERQDAQANPSPFATLQSLLPLLLLVLIPLLSSLLDAFFAAAPGPSIHFETPRPPLTFHRESFRHKLDYYVDPSVVASYTSKQWIELDRRAEGEYVSALRYDCEAERERKMTLMREAQGLFWTDHQKMARANALTLKSCARLGELGYARR